MKESRGIRNCNPANIRRGQLWKGMRDHQTDKRFVQFKTMRWGIRAMLIVLRTYVLRHGLRTVPQIIRRWAPPEDGNNTKDYIDKVCVAVEFAADGGIYYLSGQAEHLLYHFSHHDFELLCGEISLPLLAMVKKMCQIESQYTPTEYEVKEAMKIM